VNELLSVEAARDAVLSAIEPLPVERVPLGPAALGLAIASRVIAATALPPWDNSAMDGYAVRAADVAAAGESTPVHLPTAGEVAAGTAPSVAVAVGTVVRIATGAPLPSGADAVVPVEATTPLDADGRAGPRGRDATGPFPASILVHDPLEPGANVRRRGSDLEDGATLLEPGDRLTPAAIALAAGAGVAEVDVHRRPRLAVLATGDEVRRAGEPLGPAGIPDANGPGLAALAAAAGAIPVELGIAPDRLEAVVASLRAGIDAGDAVLVSGGVSVGPYDVVKLAFDAVGRVDLWRVAVQPGKPFAFGLATAPDGRRVPMFGLPGNPVSGFVTFELFVRPALARLGGHRRLERPLDRAVLLDRATKAPGRRAYLRVVSERDEAGAPRRDGAGRVLVRLAGRQGSHVLSGLAAADALAVVPETWTVVDAGSAVELWWLDR
jgi:molybdopterin molybdotransferase